MRHLNLVLSSFLLMASLAHATPTSPKNDAEYITLKTPQPTLENKSKNKVEVIEFFMYHCPACNMLEPALQEWIKKQEDNVTFKRIHVPSKGVKDVESHLFLTLEAMELENALHSKLFHTWHNERIRLTKDEDNVDWAVKNGIDKDKFLEFYNSFGVTSKLENLKNVTNNYQVNSTPTFVIDGCYLTTMSMVDKANNKEIPRAELVKATLQVVEALVAQSKTTKCGKSGGGDSN